MVESNEIELQGYNWEKAREEIKRASYMKEKVEIPAIAGCFDWKGLSCLELSRNDDARLTIALADRVKHTTILVPYGSMVDNIKKRVQDASLLYGSSGQVNALIFDPKQGLPSELAKIKYDIVRMEWVSHSWLEDNSLLEKLLEKAQKYFLVIMPHPESDDTLIASIKDPGEKDRRIRVRDNLREFLEARGWRVSYLEKKLPLSFETEEKARKTFYCMAFGNKATEEQKIRLDSFLGGEKFKNIEDSFYIMWAEKK